MEQTSEGKTSVEDNLILINQKIDYLVKQAKISATTRKISIIVALVFVLLPAIIMIFVLPTAISSITSTYSSI